MHHRIDRFVNYLEVVSHNTLLCYSYGTLHFRINAKSAVSGSKDTTKQYLFQTAGLSFCRSYALEAIHKCFVATVEVPL